MVETTVVADTVCQEDQDVTVQPDMVRVATERCVASGDRYAVSSCKSYTCV